MKRLLAIIPLLFSLLGCVQSIQPFYKDNQVFYDPKLAGTWTNGDQDSTLVITANDKDKDYNAVYTDKDSKTGRFIVHLAKVQDHMLADVYPDLHDDDIKGNDQFKYQLLPVHSFLIVEYAPPDMKVRVMDLDWFNKYVQGHPSEVAFEKAADDRIIMTAPTEQVQTFVLSHLKTPGAYGDAQDVIRIPATQP